MTAGLDDQTGLDSLSQGKPGDLLMAVVSWGDMLCPLPLPLESVPLSPVDGSAVALGLIEGRSGKGGRGEGETVCEQCSSQNSGKTSPMLGTDPWLAFPRHTGSPHHQPDSHGASVSMAGGGNLFLCAS